MVGRPALLIVLAIVRGLDFTSHPLASFADVLWAFIPAHQRLLYGV